MNGKVEVTMGPFFSQPYKRIEGKGLPVVPSAFAVTGPGAVPPTLMAAVATLPACVSAAGKGGGSVVKLVKTHCAIVTPEHPPVPGAGAPVTVKFAVALFPVSEVSIK